MKYETAMKLATDQIQKIRFETENLIHLLYDYDLAETAESNDLDHEVTELTAKIDAVQNVMETTISRIVDYDGDSLSNLMCEHEHRLILVHQGGK